MKQHPSSRKYARLPGVAAPDMLREDFETLNAKTLLRCSGEVEELILMQSIEGQSREIS